MHKQMMEDNKIEKETEMGEKYIQLQQESGHREIKSETSKNTDKQANNGRQQNRNRNIDKQKLKTNMEEIERETSKLNRQMMTDGKIEIEIRQK